MSNSRILNVVLIVLAVIGALPIIAVLAMWLMHGAMMEGTMGDCRMAPLG